MTFGDYMKRTIILITLFSTMSSYSKSYTLKYLDQLCMIRKSTKNAISFEKSNQNKLQIAVRNNSKCEIDSKNPLLIYWLLGEPQSLFNGKPTCDGLNFFERFFIKVKNKQIKIIDNKSFYWSSNLLVSQLGKFKLSPTVDKKIRIVLTGDSNSHCKAQAYIKLDKKEVAIDRIYATSSGMSLKEIEVYDKGDSILNLKK